MTLHQTPEPLASSSELERWRMVLPVDCKEGGPVERRVMSMLRATRLGTSPPAESAEAAVAHARDIHVASTSGPDAGNGSAAGRGTVPPHHRMHPTRVPRALSPKKSGRSPPRSSGGRCRSLSPLSQRSPPPKCPLPPPSRSRSPAEVLEQRSEREEVVGARKEEVANIKGLVMDLRSQADLDGVLGLSQRLAVLEQDLLERGLGQERGREGWGERVTEEQKESSRGNRVPVGFKSGLGGAARGNHRAGGGGARDKVGNETLLVSLSLPALSDLAKAFTVPEMDAPAGLSIQAEISASLANLERLERLEWEKAKEVRKRLLGRTNGWPGGGQKESHCASSASLKSRQSSSSRRSPRSPSPTHSLHYTHTHAYLRQRGQSQSPTLVSWSMSTRPHHRSLSPAIARQSCGYEGDMGMKLGKGRDLEAVKTDELARSTQPLLWQRLFLQRVQKPAEAEESKQGKDEEEDAEVLAEVQNLQESCQSVVAFARARHLLEVSTEERLEDIGDSALFAQGQTMDDNGGKDHRPLNMEMTVIAEHGWDNRRLGADGKPEATEDGRGRNDPAPARSFLPEDEQPETGPEESRDAVGEWVWNESVGKGGDETVAAPLSLSLLNSVISPLKSAFPISPSVPVFSFPSPSGGEEPCNLSENKIEREIQSVKRLSDQNLKLSAQLTDCSINLRTVQLDNMDFRRLLESERAKQKTFEDEIKRLNGIASLREKMIKGLVQLCVDRRSREMQRRTLYGIIRVVQISKDARQRVAQKNLDTQLQLRDYMAQRLQLLTRRLLRKMFRNLLYVSFVHFREHVTASRRRRARAKKADVRYHHASLKRAWILYFAATELRFLRRQNVLKRLRRFHLNGARRILRCWRKICFEIHKLHYHKSQNHLMSGQYKARDTGRALRDTLGPQPACGRHHSLATVRELVSEDEQLQMQLIQECDALALERDVLQKQLFAEREMLVKLEEEKTALSSSALQHLNWIELEYKAHQKQTENHMIHWQLEQLRKHTQRHRLHLKSIVFKELKQTVAFHHWLRRKISRNARFRVFRSFCRALSEHHNDYVERNLLEVREQLATTKKMLLLAFEYQTSSPQSRNVSPQSPEHFLSLLNRSLSFGSPVSRTRDEEMLGEVVGGHHWDSRPSHIPPDAGSARSKANSTAQAPVGKSPTGIIPFLTSLGGTFSGTSPGGTFNTTTGGTFLGLDPAAEQRSTEWAFASAYLHAQRNQTGGDDDSGVRPDGDATAGGGQAQGFGLAPEISPIHLPRHPVASGRNLELPSTSVMQHRWANLVDSPTSSPQAPGRAPLSAGRDEGKRRGRGRGRGVAVRHDDHEEERQNHRDGVEFEEDYHAHSDNTHEGSDSEDEELAWNGNEAKAKRAESRDKLHWIANSQHKSESIVDQRVVQRFLQETMDLSEDTELTYDQILPAMLRSGFSEQQCSEIFQDLVLEGRSASSEARLRNREACEEAVMEKNGEFGSGISFSSSSSSSPSSSSEEEAEGEQGPQRRASALNHSSPIVQQLAVIDGLLDDVLRSSSMEMNSHLGALAGTAPREIKTKDTSNGCQDGRVDDGQELLSLEAISLEDDGFGIMALGGSTPIPSLVLRANAFREMVEEIEMRHEELLQDVDMQSDLGSPARERSRRGEELRGESDDGDANDEGTWSGGGDFIGMLSGEGAPMETIPEGE